MNTAALDTITLSAGSHTPDSGKMCAMGAAAFIAGEPWTDSPKCVCPVIATFMRAWNDDLPNNEERDRLLKPLIPLTIGTKGNNQLKERRSFMAIDWVIRVYTPAFLTLAPSLAPYAGALTSFPIITDIDTLNVVLPVLEQIEKESRTIHTAAWCASQYPLRAASWAIGQYPYLDAYRTVAMTVARYAARSANQHASLAAISSTVHTLQQSTSNLVRDMCLCK